MNIKYWMLNFNNWSIWYSFVIYFKQFVIKKMELLRASKREKKAAEQEAKLLSKLRHPNIVSYKDSFESEEGFLYIVMGFCDGGDLYNRLKQQKNAALEERQVVEWFVQIAMALQVRNDGEPSYHIIISWIYKALKTSALLLSSYQIYFSPVMRLRLAFIQYVHIFHSWDAFQSGDILQDIAVFK